MKALTLPVLLLVALPATAWAETYTYDSRGRITHVIYDDGSEVDFSWDANGNLTRREVVSAAAIPEPPSGGQPDDGCGCSSSTADRSLSALLFAGLGLAASRRRRRST